jgi:hypothetical protein
MRPRSSGSLQRGDVAEERARYVDAMTEVVILAYENSSQNLGPNQQRAKAIFYADSLFGIVPENRLVDCFRRAFDDKDDSFVVNAYDLRHAWRLIHQEEQQAARAAIEKSMRDNAVQNCRYRKYHEGEPDDGLIAVYINGPGTPDVVVPCFECRRHAYQIRIVEVRRNYYQKKLQTQEAILAEIQKNPWRYMTRSEIVMHCWRKLQNEIRKGRIETIERDGQDYTTVDAAASLIRIAEGYQ